MVLFAIYAHKHINSKLFLKGDAANIASCEERYREQVGVNELEVEALSNSDKVIMFTNKYIIIIF